VSELAIFAGDPDNRTPASIKAWIDQVQEMRRSVLEPDVDFMWIPGTPKPSLLQPGAEKFLLLSGLGFEIERVERTPEGVTYRATIPGRAACDGYAGRDEPNLRRAPWNTIVKMAQKRAKVGAISSALALSGLFTQDLEDLGPSSTSGGAHGAQGEPATAPPVVETDAPAYISSATAKHALVDAFEAIGTDPLQARALASGLWGTRGSQPIGRQGLDEMLAGIQADGEQLELIN